MNKLFTKIATAMVGIAMAVGVGVAIGSKSDSGAREARAAAPGDEIYSTGTPSWGTTYTYGVRELDSVHWYVTNYGNNSSLGWNKASGDKSSEADFGPLTYTATVSKYGMYQTDDDFSNAQKVTFSVTNYDAQPGYYYIYYSTNGGTTWTTAVNKEATTSTKNSSWSITYDHGSKIGDNVRFAFGIDNSANSTGTRLTLDGIKVWEAASSVTNPMYIKCGDTTADSYDVVKGQSITLKANDGTSDITSDVTWNVNPNDGSVVTAAAGSNNTYVITGVLAGGTATVTAQKEGYTNKSVTINVIHGSITGLTLNVSSAQKTYATEENWNHSGITVSASYSDGDTGVDVTSEVEEWKYYYDGSASSSTKAPNSAAKNKSLEITAIIGSITSAKTSVTIDVIEIADDELTRATTGISDGGGYGTWTGKTVSSDAVYAGQSAGGNNCIQLRSNNSNSGIVTTSSGGNVKKVVVVWYDVGGATQTGRTLNVYGKGTAYTEATNLYNNSLCGDLLGTIVAGTSTELTIAGNYSYIGVRSNSGAMYLSSITFSWTPAERTVGSITVSSPSIANGWYVGDTVSFVKAGVTVTANYNDGKQPASEDVTAKATITNASTTLSNVGATVFNVSYAGQSGSFTITASAATTYTKIDSVTDLVAGSSVYISGYKIEDTSYYFLGEQNGTYRNANKLTVTDDTVSGTISANKLTVGANQYGYYFQDAANKYLSFNNANATLLQSDSLDDANFTTYWTVSFADSGLARATIKNVKYDTYMIGFSGSDRIACYTTNKTVAIFTANKSSITSDQRIDTFGKLYLHKLDILDNETTRGSDTETCYDYYDTAKAALSDQWSAIQEDFSNDTTGMWERYCKWAWASHRETPTFDDGSITYERASIIGLIENDSTGTISAIVIISVVSIASIGGYFFLRRRKEQ